MPATIVFFAAVNVFSYFGILEFVIKYMGGFLGYCLGTSAVESTNAASNMFLGGVGIQLLNFNLEQNVSKWTYDIICIALILGKPENENRCQITVNVS